MRYLCDVDKDNFTVKRIFKIKEITDILTSQGWYLGRQNGTSHRQFKHPVIKRTVTVDGKLSDDVNFNNLKSMERQSGLKFKDFVTE
jgi:predicted RNA binding protein YcfA (HicA-like mRNA interferase family)